MEPRQGDTYVSIPITLDAVSHRDSLSVVKILLGVLILIGGLGVGIFFYCVSSDKYRLWVIGAWVFLFYFVRFGFLHERYYAKKRESLISTNYLYGTGLYWGIYSIDEYFPYVCQLANNTLAIFVAFDKDVIVGRASDQDFAHYEAITEAYAMMCKKGIWCIHIDYADTIGKDDRMDSLFQNVMKAENRDIKREVTRMFDYIQSYMYRSYSDYDIYAFYCYKDRSRPETFWEDLQPVLDAFNRANYVRNRVLSRDEIADLCMTLENLTEFSVTRACEHVFLNRVQSSSDIKIIWTEKDGERTVVSRTREEIEAENRVAMAESGVKLSRRRRKRRGKQEAEVEETVVLEDDGDGVQDGGTSEGEDVVQDSGISDGAMESVRVSGDSATLSDGVQDVVVVSLDDDE